MSFLLVVTFSFLAAIADLSGLFLFWKKGWAARYSNLLVSFAAGALLGTAFLELIPEVLEWGGSLALILVGILLFYLLERVLFLYHCHNGKCQTHTFSYLMLVGNTIHDFSDGVIIALTFMIDLRLGVVTALAVIAHEFPAGVGEFSVLLHGGFKEAQALFYTILSILATPLGALVTLFLSGRIAGVMGSLLALATGGFIYIAAVDLIPETHREYNRRRSLIQGIMLVAGMLVIWIVGYLLGTHG
jgi:zinc and cadmium transporter